MKKLSVSFCRTDLSCDLSTYLGGGLGRDGGGFYGFGFCGFDGVCKKEGMINEKICADERGSDGGQCDSR
jgi:hypothetical protein